MGKMLSIGFLFIIGSSGSHTIFYMTPEQLKYIIPLIKAANLTIYVPLLNKYMDKYRINTKARIAPFISNLAHESASFNYTREIASGSAYEGRADLGNTRPGYGVKFKGRGLIQLTGYNIYHDCSDALYGDNRLLLTPSLLEQPDPATESACWFWTEVKELNVIADKPDDWTKLSKNGNTYEKFHWICRLINGGDNGLAERKEFYARALEIL